MEITFVRFVGSIYTVSTLEFYFLKKKNERFFHFQIRYRRGTVPYGNHYYTP